MNSTKIIISAVVALVVLVAGGLLIANRGGQDSTVDKVDQVEKQKPTKTEDKDQPQKPASDEVVLTIGFSFSCPYCKMSHDLHFHQARLKYGDKIVFQPKHFPFPSKPNDLDAHRAAQAADKQGKFWEMHDKLFETQADWVELDQADFVKFLRQLADDVGLDVKQFEADINSQEVLDQIYADIEELEEKEVFATPTVFIKKGTRDEEIIPIEVFNQEGEDWFINLLDEIENNSNINNP